MFGILVSAINVMLGFVFRQLVIKFVVLFALYFVVQTFVSVLGGFLPNVTSLNGAFGGIASGTWWFLDLFAFSQGFPLVVSAFAYRFLIRRIPVIG
jgi:hypothetical protein